MLNKIIIKGAREHNLKNIDVEIPRNKFVVFTGLSGSGKSSLAFDTIYAEGQRRYVESLSSYARQFLGLMEKPDVDQIIGLSPAISIDQRSASANPRSTVGTITEIYDYLRLLFARIGHPHCPICGKEVERQTVQQIVDRISEMPEGTKMLILSPQVVAAKGEHRQIFNEIRKMGFVRVRVDGEVYDIADDINLDKNKKHNIEIVVDRITTGGGKKADGDRVRITDSVEIALRQGEGQLIIWGVAARKGYNFSELFACPDCNINLAEISPRSFSFNSPVGACPECTGLGTKLVVDPELVIPNRRLTLAEGAIRPWSRATSRFVWYLKVLEAVGRKYKFSINESVENFTKKQKDILFYGAGDEQFLIKGPHGRTFAVNWEGVASNLERRYRESESEWARAEIEKFMTTFVCPACLGKRLKKEVLGVKIAGLSIDKIVSMSIDKTHQFFELLSLGKGEFKLSARESKIAYQILKEIKARLQFLCDVGLSYMTLERSASTLSGGEAQRIRLATQIGSGLTGVLYILDEPTVGLHPRDNLNLIKTLMSLRDLDNTVIVVEHDRETIERADWVVDIGPGAGEHGGQIVACGTAEEISRNKNSLTGAYLSGKKEIAIPKKRRLGNGKDIKIIGATCNNLKNIDVVIPLGKFVAVTGVSGSGKSSLVYEILAKALSTRFHHAKERAGAHKKIEGLELLDKVIDIDQSPIGRTPRSNPATYTGIFGLVRELFALTPEAKARGYKEGRFSFNVKGGRCEACHGDGVIKIEMHFLPDVYVTCDECKGKRYNREALEITYRGKNISEVLEMTVEEALEFFRHIPLLSQKLSVLSEVGLGYVRLGQSAPTLSGGEAQRVKLATELSRRATGKTIYILDEPTTGLHFDDVGRLLAVLQALVDKGNTVLVIEHNLDVIKQADWVIDLGPEGGEAGGEIVVCGTPEQIAKEKTSYTGKFLKEILK